MMTDQPYLVVHLDESLIYTPVTEPKVYHLDVSPGVRLMVSVDKANTYGQITVTCPSDVGSQDRAMVDRLEVILPPMICYQISDDYRTHLENFKPEEEKKLRRLLCEVYAGALAYIDDGELQDNREEPCIDFKRDTADQIALKMKKRSLRRLEDRV